MRPPTTHGLTRARTRNIALSMDSNRQRAHAFQSHFLLHASIGLDSQLRYQRQAPSHTTAPCDRVASVVLPTATVPLLGTTLEFANDTLTGPEGDRCGSCKLTVYSSVLVSCVPPRWPECEKSRTVPPKVTDIVFDKSADTVSAPTELASYHQ
jgi:hypothetical protein